MRILAAVILAACALAPAPACGQAAPTSGDGSALSGDSLLDDSVRAVALSLRCPVCQGESIQESPAPLAKEMRELVRAQMAAGRSSDQVKAYFVSKYGEWILLHPKARGLNLTVYVVPILVIGGGALLILVQAKRWTRNTSGAQGPDPVRPGS